MKSVPVVVSLVGVLGLGCALPSSADDGVVDTTVLVGAVEVPTAAVFRVPGSGLHPGNIVGAVHAVRRVEGGTVLYYSAAWEKHPSHEGSYGSSSSDWLMWANHKSPDDLVLVAPDAGEAYTPLDDGDAASFVSDRKELSWSGAGELQVLYAVFPELPDDVSEVYVQVGKQLQMVDRPVTVGEGALEPVVDPGPVGIGSGWPKVPQGNELSDADPAAHTFTLYYMTGSEDGALVNNEGDNQVVSTLAADVLFAKDAADLSDAAQSALDMVGADLAARGRGNVVVTGHTDSDGTDEYNLDLSRRRAQAVVDALTPLAGSSVKFEVVAKGESEPVADNSTPEGQQANRRVTVAYEVDR